VLKPRHPLQSLESSIMDDLRLLADLALKYRGRGSQMFTQICYLDRLFNQKLQSDKAYREAEEAEKADQVQKDKEEEDKEEDKEKEEEDVEGGELSKVHQRLLDGITSLF